MTPLILPFLLAGAVALPPAPLSAQTCQQGTVSHVFIDNHSIFDTEAMDPDRPFRWAYDLANTLHMRTRADFIKKELLFWEGDCYDPFLLQESERLLRDYPFISRVDVYGIKQPDGSWHVVVDTQDEWTTKLDLGLAFRNGFGFRRIEAAEQDFLGQGILLGAFFREHDEERDIGGQVALPRTFGTRLDTRLSGGRTRIGNFVREELFYPFVGEVGRYAGRQLYLRQETLFPYSVQGTAEGAGDVTHVLLPTFEERFEITGAVRLGPPGNLTVLGMGFSNETLNFPRFPGDLEAAHAENFGTTGPADSAAADAVRPQTLHSAGTRVNLLVGQRNIHFRRYRGLDALRGVHDVALGSDVSLTMGRSLALLSAGHDQPDDLYTRLRVFAAGGGDHFLFTAAASLEGRDIFSGGLAGDGWKDLLAEADLYMYWQPPAATGHTFFLRASGAGGWSTTMPYQLTLGGEEEVRGYPDRFFPGGRRLVVTAEDRIYVPWPAPDLFDLGFTLFADAGVMEAGDVPFGVNSGLQGTMGAGLRVGFPAGTRGVIRLDAAVPVGSEAGLSKTLFRISVHDLVGLFSGFEDAQLNRSRRSAVGPDFFVRTEGTR